MIVVDIDGVLSDATHRLHFLAHQPKDWDAFFAGIELDAPIESGRALLVEALAGDDVVLVTGRPEHTSVATRRWLVRHGFPALPIRFRRDTDRRPAGLVKRDILRALGGPKVVTRVVDDDARVVDTLRAAGYAAELFGAGPDVG